MFILFQALLHIKGMPLNGRKPAISKKKKINIPVLDKYSKNISAIIKMQSKNNDIYNIHRRNVNDIFGYDSNNNNSSNGMGISNITQSNGWLNTKNYDFFIKHMQSLMNLDSRLPINTPNSTYFFKTHNITFIPEKTQELSNGKIFFTNVSKKKNFSTFTLLFPPDCPIMLIFFILLRIDFGELQIEFNSTLGKEFQIFLLKMKQSGFKYYFDFIHYNVIKKQFISIRN